MQLFEQYFTDTIKYARDLYKNLRKSVDFFPAEEDVVFAVSEDPMITVMFAKAPENDTSLASFYRVTKGKRSTVVLNNGKKKRRMLVIGGIIVINVANMIQKHRHLFSLYKEIAPFIKKIKKGSYKFSDAITPGYFAIIVKTLIETNFFAQIFAHEVQHFYNPWIHKRAETRRKVKTDIPLSVRKQRQLNYHRSNAEVDSRTVESAVRVIGEPKMQDIFEENTPDNEKRFIKACRQDLINDNVWDVFPEWLQKKLIRRWSIIYQQEMQRRSLADKR